MEYEQLENANKLLHRCILTQDVGGLYEMLHPNAVLVTHFPYPEADDNSCETPAVSMLSPAIAAIRAEQLGKLTPRQRRVQLLREQAALRARQKQSYEEHLASRMDAATGSNTTAPPGTAAAQAVTPEPTPAAATPGAAKGRTSDASGSKRAEGKTAGKAAAGAASGAAPSASSGSAVAAAMQGVREHRGLTYYFHQPAPLSFMTLGGATGGDPWHGAGAGEKRAPPNAASAPPRTAPTNPGARGGAVSGAAGVAGSPGGAGSTLEAAIATEYVDFVDVAEGRLLVCARFFALLAWLNAGPYVSDIEAQLDPRKSILQDAEVLPPPPEPRTPQEAFAQLGRQHTDRNQQVSRLTMVWGREHLQFCDQVHVDDGQIICIHRRMLTLPEMLERFPTNGEHWTLAQKTEGIRQELREFYGVTGRRVAAVSHALPLLDFSFAEVAAHTARLLDGDVVPASGRRHVCRGGRPEADPRLAQGVFLNAENDPTNAVTSSRTLIKAKNKHGEEEAYEFAKGGKQRYQVFDSISGGAGGGTGGSEEDSGAYAQAAAAAGGDVTGAFPNNNASAANRGPAGGISGPRRYKFDAGSLRISGCQLRMPTSGAEAGGSGGATAAGRPPRFITIVRSLVANAMLTLHAIDLSDNCLTTIPDLSLLPLQKLMLHGNCISSWTEVEEHVCPLPYLTSVTLFGNPIADSDPTYRVQALGRLLRHPNRKARLRQLDFVMLTGQDLNQMGVRQPEGKRR